MAGKYSSKCAVVGTFLVLSVLAGYSQNNDPANRKDSIEPVTIVQSSDRVSLYPSNGHDADNSNFVYPNVIRKNGILTVFTSRRFDVIDVIDVISASGVLMLQQNIKGSTGRFDIPLKNGLAGISFVRLRNKETMIVQKIVVTE